MAALLPNPVDCCTPCSSGFPVVITAMTGFIVASTFAELRTYPSLATNRFAVCMGGITEGDGLEGFFRWDATGTAADNDISIIRPSDFVSAGEWVKFL